MTARYQNNPLITNNNLWILVTGATSGIGLDCIAPLISTGFRIIATGRNKQVLDELSRLYGDKIAVFAADLFSEESTDELLAFVKNHIASQTGARLFAVFNNAGLAYAGPLECTTPETLEEQLRINLFSVHRITRGVIPLLRETAEWGSPLVPRILFTGSVSGRYAFPLLGAYGISKFALKAYADALRVELRCRNIKVSLLELGPVKTAIWERSKKDSSARQTQYQAAHGPLPSEYQQATDRLLAMTEKIDKQALPTEAVSKNIVNLLTCKNPAPYWMPGRDKLTMTLMKFLPASLVDKIAYNTLFK